MKLSINTLFLALVGINLAGIDIAIASPADEAVLASAYSQGVNIYNTCIAVPPIDPDQVAYCTSIYTAYVVTLSILNAPFPIVPSLDPSPYSWSPFDICKYEVAHMEFNSVVQSPYYCPTV